MNGIIDNFDIIEKIINKNFNINHIKLCNIIPYICKKLNNIKKIIEKKTYKYEINLIKRIKQKLNNTSPDINFDVISAQQFIICNRKLILSKQVMPHYNIVLSKINFRFYCDCTFCNNTIPCGNGIIDEFDYDEYEFIVNKLLINYNWWTSYFGEYAYNYYDKELFNYTDQHLK